MSSAMVSSHQAAKIADKEGRVVTLKDIVAVDVEQTVTFMSAPFVSKFIVSKNDVASLPIGAQVRVLVEVIQPNTQQNTKIRNSAAQGSARQQNPEQQRAKDRVAGKKEEETKDNA